MAERDPGRAKEGPNEGSNDMLAWRHLYTWSRRGALGAPGFQTVACARELDGDRREALERWISRARPRETADGDGHSTGGARCLLLAPLATDVGRCVLSRVVATGRAPDGRPGNYWAESLVVPEAWLADAEWNLAGAFDVLSWWGPEEWARQEEAAGDWPCWLPPESLPALAAADPRDLARIAERVPEPEIRRGLLEALLLQVRESREDGTGGEPVFVVEAPGAKPQELEELLLGLPALLPPEARNRGEGDRRRCLRLATRAVPGAVAPVDLLGVPESALETARRTPGRVVDLGGAIPPPAAGEEAIRSQAEELDESWVQGGSQDALKPDESTPEKMQTSMPGKEGRSLAKTGDTPDAAAGAPPRDVAERQALWRAREEAEGAAWDLLEGFRGELDRLLEPLKAQVAEHTQKLQGEMDELSKALIAETDKTTQKLRKEIGDARREVRDEAQKQLERLQREIASGRDRLEDEKTLAIQAVEGAYRKALDQVQKSGARRRAALERSAREGGLGGDLDEVGDGGIQDWDEPEPASTGPSKARTTRSSASARSGFDRFRTWVGTGTGRGVLSALAVLLLAVALWWWAPWGGSPTDPSAGGSSSDAGSDAGGASGASGEARELVDRALERLGERDTATRLLRAAAGSSAAALRDAAAATHLRMTLGPDRGLAPIPSCAVLQAALNDGRQARGEAAIGVDGDCGVGTQAALATAVAGTGCEGATWQERGACFLDLYVTGSVTGSNTVPGRQGCPPSWPFTRACEWTDEEAARLLELLRAAGARTETAALASYDLAVQPARAGTGLPTVISGDDRRRLFRLAYAAQRATDGETAVSLASVPAVDKLTPAELRTVLAYLDRLPTPGADGGEG